MARVTPKILGAKRRLIAGIIASSARSTVRVGIAGLRVHYFVR
jgi:hypothetical protein